MRREESFHAAALAEGCGLLVDPGSHGNLVGSEWLKQAIPFLHRAGKEILRFARNSPLHVGGVGKGSQTCINGCVFPLALERSDGTTHEGTFTSPFVEESHTPALLGLRSLMRHNAILDLSKKMMPLIRDDCEAGYKLPEGTESYPLKQAPSGHLLLPFTDFKKWEQRRFEKMNIKMIHLFTDDEPRTGDSTASRSGLQRDTDVDMEDATANASATPAPPAGPAEMEVDSTPATAAPKPATEPSVEATRTATESIHHAAESEPSTTPSRKLHAAPQAARAAAGVEYGPVRRRQERPDEMEEVEVDEESGESRRVRQFRLTEAGVAAAAKAVPRSPPESSPEPDDVPQPKTPPGPPPHLQGSAASREAVPKAKRRQVPNPKGPPPRRQPPQPPQSTQTVILGSDEGVNEAKAKGATTSKTSPEKAKAPVRQPPPPPAPKRRSTSEAAKASGSSASGPRTAE